ncbi:MAG: hypothetical protein AAFQ63_12320 [Cyanobacteria bacterium J06621_11]
MSRLFRALFSLFRRSPKRLPDQRSPDQSPDKQPERPTDPTVLPSRSSQPLPENPMPPENPTPTNNAPGNSTTNSPMTLESPQPTAAERQQTSLKNLKLVLNVLRAYVVTFGQPETELDLRAVIGAIVANLAVVSIENRELEAFIDKAIAAYESIGKEASLVDVTSQLLAEQVSVWLREQEATVGNVVSAYLQQFAPEESDWESNQILGLVQTIIATLNDGSLSKSGGRALIEKVVENFDVQQALSRWVAPEWIALAQKVASYTDKEDVQLEVQSVAWAYLQQFQAILSPQLIEQIMETGPLNLSAEEVMSGDLSEFSEMLYYKYQFLEADPVVTKSHLAIANDVHKAIADLKNRRPNSIDVTKGIEGDLEISSPITGAN